MVLIMLLTALTVVFSTVLAILPDFPDTPRWLVDVRTDLDALARVVIHMPTIVYGAYWSWMFKLGAWYLSIRLMFFPIRFINHLVSASRPSTGGAVSGAKAARKVITKV